MIRTPSGNTRPALPPSLEERYGVETLSANWNPMVAVMPSSAQTRIERLGLAGDPREIDAFLDRVHLYACQA